MDDLPNAAFEIQLNALIECMNIFGSSSGSGSSNSAKVRRFLGGDDSDRETGTHDSGNTNGRGSKKDRHDGLRIDQYFGAEKGTGMRMSYGGAGHPLTLLMFVITLYLLLKFNSSETQSRGFWGPYSYM